LVSKVSRQQSSVCSEGWRVASSAQHLGVVDQDVESAEAAADVVDGGHDLLRPRHVQRQRLDRQAILTQALGGLGRVGRLATREQDVDPDLGQLATGFQADAAGGGNWNRTKACCRGPWDGPGLMRKLKALGIRLAIDDVGTGCVSSSDLPLYAFDVFKVDHQCIHDLAAIRRGRAIVQTFPALGKVLSSWSRPKVTKLGGSSTH
jgi:hypothetical protein